METVYQYDLFVSYATENRDIADYVVEKIEKRGKRCFIAPRDIRTGADYATEIVNGISNARAVLLVFSSESDKSAYVLREVNSAVSRNKTIIPLRIENFLPSEAMEFYLGPTHWLDAFPQVLDTHLDSVLTILRGLSAPAEKEEEKKFAGEQIVDMPDLLASGWTKKQVTLREIELDYLCASPDKYEVNDLTEGTPEDWTDSVQEYADTACALLKDGEMIGYCDLYPVSRESFDILREGKEMIQEGMIDLYALGGEFDAYIAMLAVDPALASQERYLQIFDWIFCKIEKWKEEDILIDRIGISVYSAMAEKFVKAFGFVFAAYNPARGKVYETTAEALRRNAVYKRRMKA